jgi:hypothetical protein
MAAISPEVGPDLARLIERCRREIAAVEAEILAGNPDLQGLCLALVDWSYALRVYQKEQRRQDEARRRERSGQTHSA